MSFENIYESRGPTGELASEACRIVHARRREEYLIPGEKVRFPHLDGKDGFELIDIIVVEIPSYENRDKELYPYNFDSQAVVRLVDSEKYYVMKEKAPDDLGKRLQSWFGFGNDHPYSRQIKLLDYEIKGDDSSSDTDRTEINATIIFSAHKLLRNPDHSISRAINILSSPFLDNFWNKYMKKIIIEGVCYSNEDVPEGLRDSLRNNLDKLEKYTPIDYHPNSNDIVRDLVHPALFSYIDKVSKFVPGTSKNDFAVENNDEFDFWGRKYEKSKFQWLPTNIQIVDGGNCTIMDYINNLNREKFPELYDDLEKLFIVFLPYFQEVWSYAKAMRFWNNQAEGFEDGLDFEKEGVYFYGEELQVIPKIVEYKLKPGQSYEGVWHAEGMSHENIVMTGIYFIDRDPELKGGKLKFKRSFQTHERTEMLCCMPQIRPFIVEKFAEDGLMPLGYFPTKEGYILVFPNCHIHKIGKFVNDSNKDARRRIIVFFFVNPERRIISTREIKPQQDVIPLETAKKYRLELMAERKFDKKKLNIRDIELCEH